MSGPTPPIARSLLTEALVLHLAAALIGDNVYVGRGLAPAAGGWSAGQPGSGAFIGYVVVKTGVATTLEPDPIGRNMMSWKCGYSLTSHGATEAHADDVADRARVAMMSFPTGLTLRGVLWGLQKVDIPQLGATSMSTAVDPPFWSVTDPVSVWLSRARGQS